MPADHEAAGKRPPGTGQGMTVQDDIRRYIVDELGWPGDPTSLTDDLDLIEQHVVDSLSIVELSTLLEQWYEITVDPAELVYEHFHSLGAIAKYVESKRPGAP